MEASAKTKAGISQVFNEVVQKILENPNLLNNTRPAKPGSGRGGINKWVQMHMYYIYIYIFIYIYIYVYTAAVNSGAFNAMQRWWRM